ncbi:MAG: hypothetical protein ABSD12_10775 [Paraburkholderia sp.]
MDAIKASREIARGLSTRFNHNSGYGPVKAPGLEMGVSAPCSLNLHAGAVCA